MSVAPLPDPVPEPLGAAPVAPVTDLRQARRVRRWWNAVRDHPVLLRFGSVGAICAVIDNAVGFTLGNTVLMGKRTVAWGIGVLVATIVSYVLNREWAFRTTRRTGVDARERVHEAARFFGVCGLALVISAVPLWSAQNVLGWNDAALNLWQANAVQLFFGTILGTLIGMAVRWTLFTRFVFVGPAAEDVAPTTPVAPLDLD